MSLFSCFGSSSDAVDLSKLDDDVRLSKQLMLQYQLLLSAKFIDTGYEYILGQRGASEGQKFFALDSLAFMAGILDANAEDLPKRLFQFNSLLAGHNPTEDITPILYRLSDKMSDGELVEPFIVAMVRRYITDNAEVGRLKGLRASILMMSEDFFNDRQREQSGFDELKQLARRDNVTEGEYLEKIKEVRDSFYAQFTEYCNHSIFAFKTFKPNYYIKFLDLITAQTTNLSHHKKMVEACYHPLYKQRISEALHLFRDQDNPVIRSVSDMVNDGDVSSLQLWWHMQNLCQQFHGFATRKKTVGVSKYIEALLSFSDCMLDTVSGACIDGDIKSRIKFDLLNCKTRRSSLQEKLIDSLYQDTFYQFAINLSLATCAIESEGENFDYADGSSLYAVLGNIRHDFKLDTLLQTEANKRQEESVEQRCVNAFMILSRCVTDRQLQLEPLLEHGHDDCRQKFLIRLHSTQRQIKNDYCFSIFACGSRLYRSVSLAIKQLEGGDQLENTGVKPIL